MLMNPSKNFGNETLCWCCRRAACDSLNECKWAMIGLPIKGWRVDKGERWDNSFIVRTCPEFKPDKCINDIVRAAIYDEYVKYKNFDGERLINKVMNRMYHFDYGPMARESYEFLIDLYLPKSLHITNYITNTPLTHQFKV